jgi:hypothetical protein
LSLLDSNLASQIVSREGNRENLSEACSQRLLFNVPYVTAKIPIYLGKNTKCELLTVFITFFIL